MSMELLDFMNPGRYLTEQEYVGIWTSATNAAIFGFWARIIAVTLTFASFYAVVMARSTLLGIFLFMIAMALTYGSAMFMVIFY